MGNGIIPKPILNQTFGFKNEAAQPILIGEHSRESQNSDVSFKMGNGIIKCLQVILSYE
jgi:hypothetical protein